MKEMLPVPVLVCLLLFSLFPGDVLSQEEEGDYVAVKAGRIITVSGEEILEGTILIRDGKIANYQAVVPSTWNASPRDERGNKGPYEASLMSNPVADPERPLEVVRTVHSFDPCVACAVHTFDPDGVERAKVRVVS